MKKSYKKSDYNIFVDKYIKISNQRITPLPIKDLSKNNLPTVKYYIDNCPDKTVKKWTDFVLWCGLIPNSRNKVNIKNKDIIAEKLIEYEKKIGRPIKQDDIKTNTIGFSHYVVTELWGSISNCRKELGLMECIQHPLKPWSYFDTQMTLALENMYNKTNSKEFTWKMLLEDKKVALSRDGFKEACERENIDIDQYFLNKGFTLLHRNGAGVNVRFDDGELCVSNLEYIYSKFLRENNIKYNRNVEYKCFDINFEGKKTNCDYVINNTFWVEICGMTKANNETWKNWKPHNKLEEKYKNKMIEKEQSFKQNNIPFLFLFKKDFNDNSFKEKTFNLVNNK